MVTQSEDTLTAFGKMKAAERIQWLYQEYGSRLVLSTSFGLQAAVMLDLVSKHAPEVPVVWIDTGYLFPESYEYVELLKKKLNLNLKEYHPKITSARQEALYGKLWEQGEEGNAKYGLINKVEPMNRALQELGTDVWLSGLRRSQSSTRVDRPFLEQQKNTLKVYPILDWTDYQVEQYYRDNDLPPHPLEAQGTKLWATGIALHQWLRANLQKTPAMVVANTSADCTCILELQTFRSKGLSNSLGQAPKVIPRYFYSGLGLSCIAYGISYTT